MRAFPALRLSLVVATLGATGTAAAQTPARPLFEAADPLTLRITAPFRELRRARGEPEFDARLEFDDPSAGPLELSLEIRARGLSRRRICDFPPLRLDFDRETVAGTVFEGQDKLKLVTHCMAQVKYREYVTLELLIYRLFNVMTEKSFRVRPAVIEYVSSDARRPESFVESAFLIEDVDEVAARLGLDVIEADALSVDAFDPTHTALVGMFHYLIGNTDFAMLRGPEGEPCCHNGTPLGRGDTNLIVLPYDFDQAGLIDAEYAVPSEALRIGSVRSRLYRGYCAVNDEILPVVELMNERRPLLESVLADGALSDRTRQRSLAYVEDYFEIVNDPQRRASLILEACR